MDERFLPTEITPVAEFKNAYGNKAGYYKQIALVEGTPEKMSTIFIRTFVEEKNKKRKYIMAMRFYCFGEFVTIDIVSLDSDYHLAVLNSHVRNLGWHIQSNNADYIYSLPYAFAGGFVMPNMTFTGSSGDYGHKLLSWDVNNICNSAMLVINNQVVTDNFFKTLLVFMDKYQKQPDFYEKLYADMITKTGRIIPQNLSTLVAMKSFDIVKQSGRDYIEVLTNETIEGLGRRIFLENIKNNLISGKD